MSDRLRKAHALPGVGFRRAWSSVRMAETTGHKIERFLDGEPFAVVGASQNRAKFGNKVLRTYLQNNLRAFPVNPHVDEVEELTAYPDLASLPEPVHAASIITPPPVTEKIVEDAIAAGIKHLWMQPGAESAAAIRRAEEAGLNVIAGGPCILVTLGFRG